MVSSNVTDSGMSESSEPMMSDSITSTNNQLSLQQLTGSGNQAQQSALSTANSGMEQGHSRNSSNTSQVSLIRVAIDFRLFLCALENLMPFFSILCRCLRDLVIVAFRKVSIQDKVPKAIRVIRGK